MELRPALLDSAITLENLAPRHREATEIRTILRAIDKLGGLYDAVRSVNEAVNPNETREARAMRYEEQYRKAVRHAKELTADALERLDSWEKTAEVAALHQAGLTTAPDNAAEIRAALRGMDKGEREKAIETAFESRDPDILSSIYQQNPILWGGVDGPLDQQFALYVDQAAPEAKDARETGKYALDGLRMATDAFAEAATKWRDPEGAALGYQQQEQYDEANAALQAALGA